MQKLQKTALNGRWELGLGRGLSGKISPGIRPDTGSRAPAGARLGTGRDVSKVGLVRKDSPRQRRPGDGRACLEGIAPTSKPLLF